MSDRNIPGKKLKVGLIKNKRFSGVSIFPKICPFWNSPSGK